MSHHPMNAATARMTYDSFGCYTARLRIDQNYLQNTPTNTTAQVTSTFTVPAVGSSITVSVTNTPGYSFVVGDHVVIGTRAGILKTPGTITTTSTYTMYRMGGYDAGANLTLNTLYMCDPDNDSNVTTCTAVQSSLGNAGIGDTRDYTVPSGNTSLVPTNSYVSFGDHTGTYVITASSSTTSITVMKVADGDVPTGTVITSTPKMTVGKLLTVVPKKPFLMQFIPFEAWYCCTQDANSSTNTPLISIGWNPNRNSSRSAFTDNFGYDGTSSSFLVPKGGSTVSVGGYAPGVDMSLAIRQDDRRFAVPAGHALMCTVNTPTSSAGAYEVTVFVKGFFSNRPQIKY